MNAESTITYESLKKFLLVILNAQVDLSRIPAEEQPEALLKVQEAKGESAALRTLRSDLAILIVPLARMPAEKLASVYAQLELVGAPSISMIKSWLSKQNAVVFQREAIASDDEFRRLGAILDGGGGLNDREALTIQAMMDRYEFGER